MSFKVDFDERQVEGQKINILGLSVAYEDGVTGASIIQEIASGEDYRGDLEFYRSGSLEGARRKTHGSMFGGPKST